MNASDSERVSTLLIALSKKYVTPAFSESAATALLLSMAPDSIDENRSNGFQYHVAEISGQLVGVIGIKNNECVYHLFVAEDYQRQGIAGQLWQVAKAACMAAGNKGEFTVNSSLYAQGIYEKLGFVALSAPQERNGVVFVPMKYMQ